MARGPSGHQAPGIRFLARQLATMGPLGHSPAAPGTIGALAAMPLAALLIGSSSWVWAMAVGGLLVLSVGAVAIYLDETGRKDPQEVVIDEVVGCLIAIACVPVDWRWWLAAFALFRLLDISKPWLVGWCDRNVPGAFGVMADDVLAGVWAGATLGMLARAVA